VGLAPNSISTPPGQDAANLTAVTVFASNVCQCIYLGRFDKPLALIDILVRTTTAYIAGAWAELAIYQGPIGIVGAAPATLTRLGVTNVAGTFNGAPGIYRTTVSLSGMSPEAELWCVLGSNSGTQFQCRGVLADDLQSGRFCTFPGRPSTSATINPTIGGAAAVPIWLVAGATIA
jgi:hypothetical protein